MSEVYPLEKVAVPGAGRPAAGTSAITLAERRPGSIVEVAVWDSGEAVPATVFPGGAPSGRTAVSTPGHLYISLAPGRYLAIGQDAGLAARLQQALPVSEGTVTDLTHGRAGIRITGAPAADLLQKGLAFDLGVEAFPPMSATTAGLAHISVTVVRLDAETFDIYAMTSFAQSLWDWVSDAAVEYGWQVAAPSV